jgi:hypothetical protein
MTEHLQITDPVVLIRVPKAFRPGLSAEALYEATRGVWKIGPRRNAVRYALAVYQGIVQEVYEIRLWQPAWTTPYKVRVFDDTTLKGRHEFVGSVASEPIRSRYVGESVAHYFKRGAQNPITYVNVPE